MGRGKKINFLPHFLFQDFCVVLHLSALRKKMNIKDYRKKEKKFYKLGCLYINSFMILIYDKKYDIPVNNKTMLKNYTQKVLIKQESSRDTKINGWK